MAGGRRPRRLSPACLFLAAAVTLLAMPGLAAARTRRYTFNVRTRPPASNVCPASLKQPAAIADCL